MYTPQDTNTVSTDETVKLDDVSWVMSPERIVDIAKRTQSIDIYPGYGFPSEGFALTSLLSSRKLGRSNGSPRPTLRICSPTSSRSRMAFRSCQACT
ncbi:hypothetical protein FIBSPDRAFT_951201 [Athelia psychrophila]|uniref:Uncharacterized protein n=1 Tax=Athelia psychrophila TaxID=1759441 RepID=A0A166MXZ4_9AGAM|nr:hypothetical protein FIBSPDRAFT_951201 [Fibularhizoctonia sp. CBS 109695]